MTNPADLTWDEAMRLAAVDRDRLMERLVDHTRPQLRKLVRKVSLLRWSWRVVDDRDGTELAAGRTLSERKAWSRCHRAYLAELTEGSAKTGGTR